MPVLCPPETLQELRTEVLSGPDQTHPDLDALHEGVNRIGAIVSLYMTAWEALNSNPSAVPEDLTPVLRLGPKSPRTVAGMLATCVSATAEDFLSRRVISDATIREVLSGARAVVRPSRGKMRARDFSLDMGEAREQIRSACKPSANLLADGWVRNIERVFSVTLSSPVVLAMTSLSWHRNHFVHGGYAGEPLDVPGETFTSWPLATVRLGTLLIQAETTPT